MAKSSLWKKLLLFGVGVPTFLYLFDCCLGPSKNFKETPLGIYQHELTRTPEKQNLIDPKTGSLALSGYGVNLEDNIIVNWEDARPLSTVFPGLNRLQYRSWNYHLLYTPKHVIQFIFVDVLSTKDGVGICPSSIIIFDKSNPRDTMHKVEEATFKCPKYARDSLFHFEEPSYLTGGNGGTLHMSVTRVLNRDEKRLYKVRLLETDKLQLDLDVEFDFDQGPSSVYAGPMNPEKTAYFSSMKKANMVTVGAYKYKGSDYKCKQGDCIMIIDNGRTHNPYGVAYFWVLMMNKLKDGRIVTFNFADGMASKYDRLDQATEDFVAVDKQLFRLDLIRMHSDDNRVRVSDKRFTVAQETEFTPKYSRHFPDNDCDLRFDPVIANSPQSMLQEGVNLGLLAFRQDLVYGYFSGTCTLGKPEGQEKLAKPIVVEVEKAYGHVEYVFSRW